MAEPESRIGGGLRVAYLTGTYPRATDTFIQREVQTLRDHGDVEVHTMSIHRPGPEHLVGPEQRAALESTTYVLPASISCMASAVGAAFVRSPRRTVRTVGLAWRTRQTGTRGIVWQAAYFVEACILARHLVRSRVHHLHNHFPDSSGTVAMLAAELAGVTFSFTIHGAEILVEPHRWRLDEKVRRALFVCSVSWYGRGQAMLESSPDLWPRIHVVHSGVDLAGYSVRSHDPAGAHVVFAGRLDPIKGLPLLLDAMVRVCERHPRARLTVIGDGPERDALVASAQRLGLGGAVTFAGFCSQEAVREHLAAADVFVLPSLFEGIPVSLMEAMATGVPVVASNLPGIAELVDHGESGWLVPVGDVDTFADRIDSLLASSELRQRFGAAGRSKVAADFDLRREGERLRRVLTGALAGRVTEVRPPLEGDRRGD